jgi:phage-related protein
VSFSLPAIKLAFEARAAAAPSGMQDDIQAVSARFDVVVSGVRPTVTGSQMAQLMLQHSSALEALRTHVNALETSSAHEHYAQVQRNLDRLIPDFLQQPTPLLHADIIAGVNAMRPSTRAHKFEEVLSRVLAEFEPLETSLESAINDMLLAIRETMLMVNPLSLRDSVAAIYDAIRAKVQVIDPDDLKDAIDAVFAPLESLVDTINPAHLKTLIDAAFTNVVQALTTNVKAILDLLVGIINEKLRAIKDALQALIDAVRTALQDVTVGLEGIITRFDNLIFVEIFDRLRQVIANLGKSFDQELARVVNAFDQMLSAIPLNGGAGAGVSV